MKKTLGYLLVGIFVIAVLVGVYFFLVKGYSKGVVNTTPAIPNETSTSAPVNATQEVGNVTSSKISLVITSPADGANLTSTNVTVKGKTSANADVFVNDQSGKADANGNFAISIGLDEGINQILVSANDSLGNAVEKDISVTIASFQ